MLCCLCGRWVIVFHFLSQSIKGDVKILVYFTQVGALLVTTRSVMACSAPACPPTPLIAVSARHATVCFLPYFRLCASNLAQGVHRGLDRKLFSVRPHHRLQLSGATGSSLSDLSRIPSPPRALLHAGTLHGSQSPDLEAAWWTRKRWQQVP